MGLQWSLVKEHLDDGEKITDALKAGYEPFAVNGPSIFFKKQYFSEDDEARSSTKEENANWAGTQTTE